VNPLSFLYGTATAIRNHFYDSGTFKSRKLSRPVISVGNISVGGSGKTPFVILLGELLKQRGIAFDVLSRGYGRETHGVLVVDPTGSARDFGDEPLLIARRLGCPVVVGQSRYKAGMFAERNYDSAIHILDDGFQHRALARDLDIVLLSAEDLRDQLLPAGRLREPVSSLRRADAFVATEEIDPARLPPGKFVWHVRRSLAIPAAPRSPVAFCGIARPQKFIEQLRTAEIQPVAEKFYRDHHRYSQSDVLDLKKLRNRCGAGGFITTEKDLINLGPYVAELAPISVARVEMELVSSPDTLDTILRVIAERRAKA
jgi:tetraacyldisaccharide 4'-kinase